MIDLFFAGGPIIMSILTLQLIAVVVSAFKFPEWTKELGIFALATGILGQVIGLYGMFEGIESFGGNINQAMIAGGLKYSTISTIFGLLIFMVSLVIRVIQKPRFV
ncbi:MotA/TolQ/ExbB proton channel family protein [Algoriphagus limi]|uniref:MotA/TolQ/ExbB proton channel family protein n=1 Tax=Algoriphagus limi TaxID=2975273 RepID=A0ABT2G4K6_9BACT|nr:MotA/TolQ/ExbB proton channel family protein [Algoriphagus limi]MCS5490194.1 MotA/TolQ/ExbB proton channel family protein [Algoriphagus limi]